MSNVSGREDLIVRDRILLCAVLYCTVLYILDRHGC